MRILKLIVSILCLVCTLGCSGNHNISDGEKTIKAWIGREIVFPSELDTLNFRQDFYENANAHYKIVVYTDSIGCTSCKLQLYKWNTFIKEVGMSGLVNFYFYFQSQNEGLLRSILKCDNFKLPIYIDKENKFADINKFPSEMKYQCFLLDADNRVVLMGSPVLNTKMWDLYKQVLEIKENKVEQNLTVKTTVEIKQRTMELDSLEIQKESVAVFVLTNAGDAPLCIYDITTSCGCTIPEWDKRIVKSKEKTEIKVKVTPNALGYFNKKINVFCNIRGGTIKLTVKGTVRDKI